MTELGEVGLKPTAVSEGVATVATSSFVKPTWPPEAASGSSLTSGAESEGETGEDGFEPTTVTGEVDLGSAFRLTIASRGDRVGSTVLCLLINSISCATDPSTAEFVRFRLLG